MRNYNDFMEALSMKDMKDLGGTDAQKKIAQDRQRRREAKNRGMANPNEEPTSTAAAADAEKKKPDLRKSQIGKWSEGIKKAPKGGALAIRSKEEPQKPSSTAIVKREKTREENKAEAKQKMASGSAGEPKLTDKKKEDEKERGTGVVNTIKDKKKKKKKKGPNLLDRTKSALRNRPGAVVGTSSSGNLEGVTGKQTYE